MYDQHAECKKKLVNVLHPKQCCGIAASSQRYQVLQFTAAKYEII